MGLLRLELDIDADVYPELHATLTSLVSDASRGERLRQLAAAGLVWEKLRIRGQAALHGVAPGPDMGHGAAGALGPGLGPVPSPTLPAPAPRAAKAGSRSTSRQAPAAAPVRPPPAPPRPGPAGFVDLALDAAPEPADVPWPPVLMDVVEPASYTHAVPVPPSDDRPSRPMPLGPVGPVGPVAVPAPAAALAPVPAVVPVPVAAPARVAPPVAAPRAAPAPVPVPVPVSVAVPLPVAAAVDEPSVAAVDPPRLLDVPIEHRSSTRSRLARMKERGLFKNE